MDKKAPVKNKKKGVVYTCITNQYDELHNHTFHNPDWDYVCLTDDFSIASDNNNKWLLKPLKFKDLDKTRNQRWHKTHPHLLFPDYNLSLYVDGNIDILTNEFFVDVDRAIKNGDLVSIAPHPERNCIYQEYQKCVNLALDDHRVMSEQIELIRKDNYSINNGLQETGIIYRKHNSLSVIQAMQDWWWWIKHYSKRDQLSLNYVVWKNKLQISQLSNTPYRKRTDTIYFWPHKKHINNDIRLQHKIISNLAMKVEFKNSEINRLRQRIKKYENLILVNIQLNRQTKDVSEDNKRLSDNLKLIKRSKFFYTWQALNKLKRLINV